MYEPSFVEPDSFEAGLLQGHHDDVDVVVAEPKRRPVRIEPSSRGTQLGADGVQVGLGKGCAVLKIAIKKRGIKKDNVVKHD